MTNRIHYCNGKLITDRMFFSHYRIDDGRDLLLEDEIDDRSESEISLNLVLIN